LGFRSRCSIDSGIEEIRELLIANRFRDLDNPRYSNKAFLSVFNTHNPRVQQEAAK
jgi:hypothetical protein